MLPRVRPASSHRFVLDLEKRYRAVPKVTRGWPIPLGGNGPKIPVRAQLPEPEALSLKDSDRGLMFGKARAQPALVGELRLLWLLFRAQEVAGASQSSQS